MRVPFQTPNSLRSHTGETRTSLRTRTRTLPHLMGELHRLAARVARGVRITTMRSPTVSECPVQAGWSRPSVSSARLSFREECHPCKWGKAHQQ